VGLSAASRVAFVRRRRPADIAAVVPRPIEAFFLRIFLTCRVWTNIFPEIKLRFGSLIPVFMYLLTGWDRRS